MFLIIMMVMHFARGISLALALATHIMTIIIMRTFPSSKTFMIQYYLLTATILIIVMAHLQPVLFCK